MPLLHLLTSIGSKVFMSMVNNFGPVSISIAESDLLLFVTSEFFRLRKGFFLFFYLVLISLLNGNLCVSITISSVSYLSSLWEG